MSQGSFIGWQLAHHFKLYIGNEKQSLENNWAKIALDFEHYRVRLSLEVASH